MIRVLLPLHLRTLAKVEGEVELAVEGTVSVNSILDELETRYPMLRGTIREHETAQRRPRVRFYAMQEDITHDSFDAALATAIAEGTEPFLIVGAIAGG